MAELTECTSERGRLMSNIENHIAALKTQLKDAIEADDFDSVVSLFNRLEAAKHMLELESNGS